jgi:O-acetyl-ADP-ribose deacetylase (regulator of RNase III)
MYNPLDHIRIVQGDITNPDITKKIAFDIIVNDALPNLSYDDGFINQAIHAAAGRDKLTTFCETALPRVHPDHSACKPGEVVWTRSGDLLRRGIFGILHAVGPDLALYGSDRTLSFSRKDKGALRSCYITSLEYAFREKHYDIAFPMISCARDGRPLAQATEIAIRATTEWLREHPTFPGTVYFVCPNEIAYNSYKAIYRYQQQSSSSQPRASLSLFPSINSDEESQHFLPHNSRPSRCCCGCICQ